MSSESVNNMADVSNQQSYVSNSSRHSKNLLLYFTLTSKLIQLMSNKLAYMLAIINKLEGKPDPAI